MFTTLSPPRPFLLNVNVGPTFVETEKLTKFWCQPGQTDGQTVERTETQTK